MSRFKIFNHKDDAGTTEYITEDLHAPMRGVFVGATGSGKTSIMKSLVFNDFKKYFKQVYLFSGTAKTINEFKDIHKHIKAPFELIVMSGYNDGKVKELIDAREDKIREGQSVEPCLYIFDDLAYANISKKHTNNQIDRIFQAGRHTKASVFITAQKYTNLNASTRAGNPSIVFVFRNGMRDIKTIFEEQGSEYVDTFEEFMRIYRREVVRNKFGFIAIDKMRGVIRNSKFEAIKQVMDDVEDEEDLEVIEPEGGEDEEEEEEEEEKPRVVKFRSDGGRYFAVLSDGTEKELTEEQIKFLIVKLRKN